MEEMRMKVAIDRCRCTGYGTFEELCPNVFEAAESWPAGRHPRGRRVRARVESACIGPHNRGFASDG